MNLDPLSVLNNVCATLEECEILNRDGIFRTSCNFLEANHE